MRTRLLRRASVGALALTLIGATAALADNVGADADTLAASVQTSVDLGAIDCGVAKNISIPVWITRKGANYPSQNVFANGAVVSITATPSSAEVSASSGSITLPGSWATIGNNQTSAPFNSAVSITSTSSGTHSATLNFTASGEESDGGTVARSLDPVLTLNWTTNSCVTNTAPAAPGAPVASENPTQGGFTLSWAASTDKQTDAFTYTLEGKDTDDAAFTTIASGLTTNSYAFGPGAPAQGTWTYRVKAVETNTLPALSSSYSPDSAGVVVDRTAPLAPSASPDRPRDYSDGATDWWKDTVTVSFQSNGDPSLSDGSIGSGVTSTTGAQTFNTTGGFTASGTSTDNAANVSTAGTLSGSVDATAPSVTLTCPTGPIYFGDSVAATWSASDVGAGLNGASSGTVALNTTSLGSKSASITSEDLVGHSTTDTCGYTVLAWTLGGFYQPVDMNGVYNTVKGGATVPLKFEVFAGSTELTSTSSVKSFAQQSISCSGTALTDEVETTTTGGTSLRYDSTAGQFIQNWLTPKAPGACYKVTMTTQDSSSLVAYFKLK